MLKTSSVVSSPNRQKAGSAKGAHARYGSPACHDREKMQVEKS
jgi:hypothetical protein